MNYFSSINTIMQIRLQVFYLILSGIEIGQSAYVKYDVISNKTGTVFWKSLKNLSFQFFQISTKSQFFENFFKISFFRKSQFSRISIFRESQQNRNLSKNSIFPKSQFSKMSIFLNRNFSKIAIYRKSHFFENLNFS